MLDVGAGYGVVTEEVLRAFPEARVTWQDYSQPMREHAQQRLAKHAARLDYVLSDLAGPGWGKASVVRSNSSFPASHCITCATAS